LQETRDNYYSSPHNLRDPEKNMILDRELEKLKEEQDVIKAHNAELANKYRYADKLPYTHAIDAALEKLDKEQANIQARINKIRQAAAAFAKK
jgi:hypothetical protein